MREFDSVTRGCAMLFGACSSLLGSFGWVDVPGSFSDSLQDLVWFFVVVCFAVSWCAGVIPQNRVSHFRVVLLGFLLCMGCLGLSPKPRVTLEGASVWYV